MTSSGEAVGALLGMHASERPPVAAGPALAFAGEGLIELTLDGERARLDYGGDAANAATMCARLGAPVRLLGRVGDDPLGRRLLRFWQARGVDTSGVAADPDAPTGIYVNELPELPDQPGRTFTYWRRGSAGSRWSPVDVRDPELLKHVAALVVTGVTVSVSASCGAAAWQLIDRARASSVPVACILNYRAPLAPDREALARLAMTADVVIASVEDLEQVFPGHTPTTLLTQARGRGQELVVTNGADGASVILDGAIVRQRVVSVSVRDTVGAGDALAGAYLWARFHSRRSPAEAIAWGAAASMLSVQQDGCASSYPDAATTSAMRAQLPPAERRPPHGARN